MTQFNHIGLENFRLFKNKTSFDLAPITILTGINNSGKSSLIKAFLLMKSSLEKTKTLEELDFSGSGHNLNDFKNTLNYNSHSNVLYFTFNFHIRYLGNHLITLGYHLSSKDSKKGTLVSIEFTTLKGVIILKASHEYDDDFGPNITYRVDLNYFLENLDSQTIELNLKGKGENYFKFGQQIQKYSFPPDTYLFSRIENHPDAHDQYKKLLIELLKNGIKEQTGSTLAEMKRANQSILYGLEKLGQNIMLWIGMNQSPYDINLADSDYGKLLYEDFSSHILLDSIKSIENQFSGINHFSSVRSDSKIIYSDKEKDLLNFFLKYEKESTNFNYTIKEFIEKHLQFFSIGEAIDIKLHKDYLVEVFILRDNKYVLLSDLGFGYTQLLPIIMRIALTAHNNRVEDFFDFELFNSDLSKFEYFPVLFLLEEPESNLHPAYQSKLADMIAEATMKFNIQFIIETHSEYLIRKFQYLIAKRNEFKPESILIYYFHQPESEEFVQSPYRIIKIKNDGALSNNFGEGFFDESGKIAFELFLLNNNYLN